MPAAPATSTPRTAAAATPAAHASAGVRTLSLQGGGAWLPVGHSQAPPTLSAKFRGPPQRVDPITGKTLTRLVKDVLRVGRWAIDRDKTGGVVYWDVTPATLRTLAANFAVAQSRGVPANIGKTHGDGVMIHPDDLIAPIDQVAVDDGTLWIAAYVDDEQRDYLLNPARKVSVGVLDNFLDGQGNRYSMALIHAAVTDQPVMTGQGPWRALAADSLNNPSTSPQGTGNMDFAALVEGINAVMAAAGLGALPDDTNEENIAERLKGIAIAIGGSGETETETEVEDDSEATAAETGAAIDEADGFGMGYGEERMLSNVLNGRGLRGVKLRPFERAMLGAVKTLSNQLNALSSEKAANQKAAFEARLVELGKAGVDAKRIQMARTMGAQQGYSLSLLDLLAPSVSMKTLSRGSADGSAPAVPGPTGGARRTDAEVEASLKARNIPPVKFHRAS